MKIVEPKKCSFCGAEYSESNLAIGSVPVASIPNGAGKGKYIYAVICRGCAALINSGFVGKVAISQEPIRGITKLDAGCAYAVALPINTSPRVISEHAEYWNSVIREMGVDVKFIFVPAQCESARLDELESELARVKEFVGGPA